MENLPKEYDPEVLEIRNEYFERLRQKRDHLLFTLEEVEKLMKDGGNNLKISNTPLPLLENKSSERIDLMKLKSENSYDLFLWGVEKRGGQATVAEVYAEVEVLDLDFIKQKILNKSFRQWLNASANYLHKKGLLEKLKRKDRKGGVMYKKKG
jgi:hypothetical protein